MELYKQGRTPEERRYEEAKKAATDSAQRRRIFEYHQRQLKDNLAASGVIVPDNMK